MDLESEEMEELVRKLQKMVPYERELQAKVKNFVFGRSEDSNLNDEKEFLKLMEAVDKSGNLDPYETVKELMIREPLAIPYWMYEYFENHREQIEKCEVTKAFFEILSTQMVRSKWPNSKCAEYQEAILEPCTQLLVLWQTMVSLIEYEEEFDSEEFLSDIENTEQYFNLHNLPTADVMRDMAKAAPGIVLQHLAKLLIAEDGSEYLESKQLEEYQSKRNTLLKDKIDLLNNRNILQTIGLLYLVLKVFVETAKREFYKRGESQKITNPLKRTWFAEIRPDVAFIAMEDLPKKIGDTEVPSFQITRRHWEECLQLFEEKSWKKFSKQEQLLLRTCNAVGIALLMNYEDRLCKVNQESIDSRREIEAPGESENPKSPENPKPSKEALEKAESSSKGIKAIEESKNPKRKNTKKTQNPSPETLAASKADDCANQKCMDLKKLYRQEQNNRTIAEGELKRAAHKIKGYDMLKKEEENWKVEKKRMEKEMRRLRESKDNEIKELKEEIDKLKESNKSMEEHRKNTFELYLETKKSLQETTRSFESLRDSTMIINMETKRVLEENRQLNGPYTLKYSSPEHKLKVFKELKVKFNPTEITEKVNAMAEIFPGKSPEFEDALKSEQERVETSSDIYSRILDYNLKLIEDTNSTTGLLPVPFAPGVSEGFKKIFEKELDLDKEDKIGTELGKECYVCFKRLEVGEKIYACTEFYKHIVCFESGTRIMEEGTGKCGVCQGDLKVSTYDASLFE